MTTLRLLAAAALALALAGCMPATFDHPVSDPAAARPDPALFGAWVKEGTGEPEILSITPLPRGGVQLVIAGADSSSALGGLTLRGFASRLGGKRYLSLRPLAALRGHGGLPFVDWHERSRFAKFWLVLAYDVSPDGVLSLAFFDDEKADALIRAGRLRGTPKKGHQGPRVTASAEELARILPTLPHEDCFESEDAYHRLVPPAVDTTRASPWKPRAD